MGAVAHRNGEDRDDSMLLRCLRVVKNAISHAMNVRPQLPRRFVPNPIRHGFRWKFRARFDLLSEVMFRSMSVNKQHGRNETALHLGQRKDRALTSGIMPKEISPSRYIIGRSRWFVKQDVTGGRGYPILSFTGQSVIGIRHG